MSPRKTRRGAKSEGVNDTLSETISKKEMADSPSEKEQKTRTRRRATKASPPDSDADHSPEMNKSRRRTVQTVVDTPSKATRSRKKLVLDSTTIEEGEITTATKAKTRRTRRKKEDETLPDQTVLLDSTTLDESANKANKSRGARARKKPAKKADEEAAPPPPPPPPPAAPSPTRRRINASAAENVTIIDAGIDSTTNDDGVPMSDEDTEVLQVSSRISRLKTAAAAVASPAPKNRRSRSTRHRLEDFTPESSPLTVNLTPHRTTKTPRKSPMNLGSPKSHADAPLRLSKTPRKLPVVVESPVPSEMSVTSSTHSTPDKQEKASPSRLNASRKPKKSPRSSPAKSPRRSPGKTAAVRKFSKSPKIVLRSPKAKSPRSKNPRVTATKLRRTPVPRRSAKSPRTGKIPQGSPTRSARASPGKTSAPPSPGKSGKELASPRRSTKVSDSSLSSPSEMSLQLARIDSPKSPRTTKLADSPGETRATDLPMVIVNKISLPLVATAETVTRSSAQKTPVDSASSTPVRSPSAEKRSTQGAESPHRPKSTIKQKRSAITDSGTPLRPIDSPLSAVKSAAAKSIVLSSSETPADIERTKLDAGGRMLSSTPRERIRRSLNLSPGLGVTSVVDSPVNGEVPACSSTMINEGRSKRRSFRLEDVTNPLISEDDESASPRAAVSRLDGTFEVVKDGDTIVVAETEGEKSGNGTYDLAEPKTPNLRRKAAKRSLGEADDSIEERAVKRTCRVRFASPTSNEDEAKTSGVVPIGRSRSATPGHRAGIARTPQTPRESGISGHKGATGDVAENKSRRRSNSVSNATLLKTPVAAKRRSTSVSDVGARSISRKAQNASVNRLSKPRLSIPSAKKPEVKTPVARKAPNFAQIHQKKFSQMESLVDAKKRVEKRHIAMNSKIPTNIPRVNSKVTVKPAVPTQPVGPVVPVNGAYNRYGFKLRKDDATKLVAQKQPERISQKKTNENRLLLKGVRTNRRFDLIMKARNINI